MKITVNGLIREVATGASVEELVATVHRGAGAPGTYGPPSQPVGQRRTGRARPPAPDTSFVRVARVSVINRRNAVMGWAVWKIAKRVGKKKARDATPTVEGGKPNKSLIAVVLAAVAGAAAFMRGRRSDGSD